MKTILIIILIMGSGFSSLIETDLDIAGINKGDLAWGNYDNDGYLDLLLK